MGSYPEKCSETSTASFSTPLHHLQAGETFSMKPSFPPPLSKLFSWSVVWSKTQNSVQSWKAFCFNPSMIHVLCKWFYMLSIWNHINLASFPVWLWILSSFALPHLTPMVYFLLTVLQRISSFLILLLPCLLPLFASSCEPHPSTPQPGLLPWKSLSSCKFNCWIFLCVASPGCTGLSPLQVSEMNIRAVLRQPPCSLFNSNLSLLFLKPASDMPQALSCNLSLFLFLLFLIV